MSATTTLAPSRAKADAAAAPRPRAPPVTIATLPFMRSTANSASSESAPSEACVPDRDFASLEEGKHRVDRPLVPTAVRLLHEAARVWAQDDVVQLGQRVPGR